MLKSLNSRFGAGLLAASVVAAPALASKFPVTIKSCDREVTFTKAPTKAVVNDVNIIEYLLALDLQDKMAGYSSLSSRDDLDPKLRGKLDGVKEIAKKYPPMEAIVKAGADIYVAGWNYGMKVGGEITPETLGKFGIKHYAIQESCAHVMKRGKASIDDMYTDLLNIGAIFGVRERAELLVAQLKGELKVVAATASKNVKSVFVYDSGEDTPFTAGSQGMPTALIAAAGGDNILSKTKGNWIRVNWEDVVKHDPEHIIIVDYGKPNAKGKIAFLEQHAAMKNVKAVKNKNYTVLTYAEATPSIKNIQAVKKLAADLAKAH